MKLKELKDILTEFEEKLGPDLEVRLGRELSEDILTCGIDAVLVAGLELESKKMIDAVFLINRKRSNDDFLIETRMIEKEIDKNKH